MWIDTHCHLNDEAFLEDVEDVIAHSRELGVRAFVIPSADPEQLHSAIRIAERYQGVYFSIGIHPCDLHKGKLLSLLPFLDHEKCIGFGECGLDYFRLPEDPRECIEYKNRQKILFREHIQLALKHDLPLILHIREASLDAAEILSEYPKVKGVFHCFSGDPILLNFSSNFYYGVGGICTFKNAQELVKILPSIPLDRLILETDSPYLAPTPHRGKRNNPFYIPLIAKKVAEILNLNVTYLEEITTKNAQFLFNLKLEIR